MNKGCSNHKDMKDLVALELYVKKKKISLCGLKFIATCIDVNLDEPLILKLPCKKYQN